MKTNKIILVIIVSALIVSFFIFDLGQYLSFDYLKANQERLGRIVADNYLVAWFIFFVVYVSVVALSIPGATVMTLAIGAVFGFWSALLLVSFASSIGATLAFLFSRYLLRDTVNRKYGSRLAVLNDNLERDGAFYLFTLRLIPLMPFFLINLLFGLTKVKTWVFYAVSQIGMLAGTAVYVNAGTQLAKLESVSEILSLKILLSFALLGVFPLLAKKIIEYVRVRKIYKPFSKPKLFDNNVIVIGGGSGGLVSAYISAAVKAKVTLIEKHKMGGDCLNTGCVPSKALIKTGRVIRQIREAEKYGLGYVKPKPDFAKTMRRVHEVISKVEPHDSIERYQGLGVNVVEAEAQILSPFEVKVGDTVLTTENIVVATGATPFVPPIENLDTIDYLTSDNIWDLKELPPKLLVLGAGPIGCELSQAFTRLGSRVTIVEKGRRLLGRSDQEVSEFIESRFVEEGIGTLKNTQVRRIVLEGEKKYLEYEQNGTGDRIEFDEVLIALGRKANVTGFGLEELGVEISERGTIAANEFMATNFPNIFVAGDVTGPYQFTHAASHQAWYATVNALFGSIKKFRVDYKTIPKVIFTDPEIAQVGLDETSAKRGGVEYEVTSYDLDNLDRAIAESADYGWVKVLTIPGKDKILGATIVGEHAGELLAEFVLAMKHSLGLSKILGTIHAYPTWVEANKYVAGSWRRNHTSETVLEWLARFHRWRRND